MRKYLSQTILLLLCLVLACARAWADEVVVGDIPSTADQFTELRDRLATTPEGGAATTVAALLAFSKDPQLGLQCLTLILDQRNVGQGNAIKGHAPISAVMYHVNRISGYNMWPYLGFAYVRGGMASSNYVVSPPYTVVTKRQKNSGSDASGQVQIFVHNDGFSPRPVTLKRNEKGIWKAYEMSSLFLNVNPPAKLTPKDDL